jgi:hypothetical protein
MPTPEWPDGISGACNRNIDFQYFQSVRPAELHCAEDGSGLQATLGAQATGLCSASGHPHESREDANAGDECATQGA